MSKIAANFSRSALHPSFTVLVEKHLQVKDPLNADDLSAALETASPSQRLALGLALNRTLGEIDREMEHAMDALDQSMDEAAQLNKELSTRAASLESALAAKETALLELGAAKVQLLNQEKLASIGTLAAGIAHEINTPTQFVCDNLSFLKDAFGSILQRLQGMEKDSDLEFFCEEIPGALQQSLDGMERVANIVRSMKEFSHPGKGGKQAVDLNRHILSTITVCRNEWKYVAEMETVLDESLPPVPCASDEINQVVLNLLVNASHAIQDAKREGQKGLIRVSTQREGDGVRIDISDSGCGISDAIKARVFDPFFTTKEVGRGTGQGLALAHSVVVQRHQGRLGFDSVPGQGTTFHLWLPLAGSLT